MIFGLFAGLFGGLSAGYNEPATTLTFGFTKVQEYYKDLDKWLMKSYGQDE